MHVLLVEARGKQFNVASTTVNALLMFHRELDDQRLALVAEVIETGGQGVEAGVLARLQTCSRNSVSAIESVTTQQAVLTKKIAD